MSRWWERNPERLAREHQALENAGFPYSVVSEDLAEGIYSLRVTVKVGGAPHDVIATYPDLFPFFRFQVRAPDVTFAKHQHPFGKTLCLIGRAAEKWRPNDTLAEYLQVQLPLLRQAVHGSPEEAAAIEEHQGEPFTDYFTYAPAMCLVDSSWAIPIEADFGLLELGIIDLRQFGPNAGPFLTAAVLEVRDPHGVVIATADPAIRQSFGHQTFTGRWCRLDDPTREAHADLEAHASQLWKLGQRLDVTNPTQRPYKHDGQLDISVRGFVIREEVGYGTKGDGWFFVVRIRPLAPAQAVPRRRKHALRPERSSRYYLARGGRAGREDLIARAPALRPLRSRRIAQVGLGCLGGYSVLEFARAGVGQIRVLEHDIVEPGTVLRWPLGLGASGMWKGAALGAFIAQQYPYTTFEPRVRPLGAIRSAGDAGTDEENIEWLLRDSSLVYDASAHHGVQQTLATYSRAWNLPYVRVAASYGSWGGYVLRIRPGQTSGCAWCFYLHQKEGKYRPPADEAEGKVQPLGCANPTYIGAGFELEQVALQGVRLAISTLGADADDAFPDVDWDIVVIELRGPGGEVIAPRVTTAALERHPACTVCASSSSRTVPAPSARGT